MNLQQFYGGITNDETINNENIQSSNVQKDINIKAGSSSIAFKNNAENIGLAVFKGDKLVR